jgi:hypothetical protein
MGHVALLGRRDKWLLSCLLEYNKGHFVDLLYTYIFYSLRYIFSEILRANLIIYQGDKIRGITHDL